MNLPSGLAFRTACRTSPAVVVSGGKYVGAYGLDVGAGVGDEGERAATAGSGCVIFP
jgi:hypothetical protein